MEHKGQVGIGKENRHMKKYDFKTPISDSSMFESATQYSQGHEEEEQ